MKNISKLMICGLTILALTGCGNKTSPSNGKDNIVTFNDEKMNITVDDLYKELKNRYATNYLIDTIDNKILDIEYEDSEDGKNYVENQMKIYRLYYGNDESSLLEAIQSAGYSSLSEFEDVILTNYKRTQATTDYVKSTITEDEIKKYYDENVYGDVTISHILVKLDTVGADATDEEKKEAEKKAQDKIKEIYEKLDGGTSFIEVAKEYSEDTATSSNGGRIGTFNKGEMTEKFNAEFENAVLKLEVGKYTSKVIESNYGYHIIYKENEKEKPELNAVKKTIVDVLTEQKEKDDTKSNYKALIALREKYGVKFNDEEINSQYETAKNNWLYSKD